MADGANYPMQIKPTALPVGWDGVAGEQNLRLHLEQIGFGYDIEDDDEYCACGGCEGAAIAAG